MCGAQLLEMRPQNLASDFLTRASSYYQNFYHLQLYSFVYSVLYMEQAQRRAAADHSRHRMPLFLKLYNIEIE